MTVKSPTLLAEEAEAALDILPSENWSRPCALMILLNNGGSGDSILNRDSRVESHC